MTEEKAPETTAQKPQTAASPSPPSLEERLSDFEAWVHDNRKLLIYAVGGVLGLIVLFLAVSRFYLAPRNEEANNQMFMAQQWFGQDSLRLALEGDGNYPGFRQIISDYRWTDAANLAHYYAGICLLRMGSFEEALDHLKAFKGRDKLVTAMAYAAMGDAYSELGQMEKAVSYYKKAAYHEENELISPVYLKRAGLLLERLNRAQEALQLYQEIKTRFPNSVEGREMDKYIGRVESAAVRR
ncbi:MAG: tetratricopeptide repeat protein [Chitinophagales bacterium]|nr:tetratricopeptide repeat protein [Chitinophagales bacterium]MDW8392723.1 tetratricopeptide repeat protein [Chitinophagales bacterium]